MVDASLEIAGPDSVAHLVQVALTPVFLLSGIGTLLGMFNLRQNRIGDHIEHLTDQIATAEEGTDQGDSLDRFRRQLSRLHRRRAALDLAAVMGALGAASTCGAAFVLFLGSVRDAQVATALFALLGAALLCTVLALVAFLADTVLDWHGLRIEGPLPPKGRPLASAPGAGP